MYIKKKFFSLSLLNIYPIYYILLPCEGHSFPIQCSEGGVNKKLSFIYFLEIEGWEIRAKSRVEIRLDKILIALQETARKNVDNPRFEIAVRLIRRDMPLLRCIGESRFASNIQDKYRLEGFRVQGFG